jgi:membrane-anchored protein YejM (alkaline phosphatase superfamily)
MQEHPGSSDLAARISSYELAFRMQDCAPSVVDIDSESEATKKLYGLDDKVTEPFGRQCLLARRLVENGVRFVQLFQGGRGDQMVDTWDAHDNIKANHTKHGAEADLPIAALLTDLKARGLLDSTLVIFHSEFGRMPISQKGLGRDHNPGCLCVWMAGAGIKGGQIIGASDEFGYKAEQQTISYHDLHATILHLLGIDHTKLTYRFNGRNMRLTDVYGELVPQIVA